jgi:hypothetical protein
MLANHLVLLASLLIAQTPPTPSATMLAKQILDDAQPADKRRQLAAESAPRAGEIVSAMTADLPAGDAAEEYRRIPWIWRVSIAAGRQNEAGPLKALLEASLPQEGEKLRDWQAVVIGGGVINGIGLEGVWPKQRIDELIGQDQALRRRWQQALAAAAAMADDANVKTGTRYDALRMIALDPQEPQIRQLVKYLAKESNAELQMGAVSGLADVDSPEAARLLAAALPDLTPGSRTLAIEALLRDKVRARVLLGLLESGKLPRETLSQAQRQKLLEVQKPD